MFLLYSALTGLAISSIFIYYSQTTIAYTFWVTAGMFLFSSVVGLFIKGDMSNVGRFLMLALLGWLFGWIFVLFFPLSPGLNQAMNFTGILLFAGLTVWDTNRLKELSTPTGGQTGHGRVGYHRCVGTLPGLYQPVPVTIAHLQALSPGARMKS